MVLATWIPMIRPVVVRASPDMARDRASPLCHRSISQAMGMD